MAEQSVFDEDALDAQVRANLSQSSNPPPPPPPYPLTDLIACAGREVGMRTSCYPKWDKVDSVAELKPARQKELGMMKAIHEHLKGCVLTEREQQAIANIEFALYGNEEYDEHAGTMKAVGEQPGPGAWDDCGEVDVPVLLDLIKRLTT